MKPHKSFIKHIPVHLVMILGGLIMAYPLLFAVLASLMTTKAYSETTWLPIPRELNFENYRILLLAGTDIPGWFLNTVLRIGWYIIIPGAVSVLCGYVFARLRFWGRDAVFMLLLASMMIPPIVYLVPTYVMLARWPLSGGNDLLGQGGHGLINQWPALLLAGLINPYYVFLFRQSYYSIPTDYEEAARLDGANTLQILQRIYVPMLKPAITVLVIFQSVEMWNDYLWPLITVGGNKEIWPIALGMQTVMAKGIAIKGVVQSMLVSDYPFLFTVSTVATLPMILLYLFLQRYFVQGVQGFGVKE